MLALQYFTKNHQCYI